VYNLEENIIKASCVGDLTDTFSLLLLITRSLFFITPQQTRKERGCETLREISRCKKTTCGFREAFGDQKWKGNHSTKG